MKKFWLRVVDYLIIVWLALAMVVQFALMLRGRVIHEPNKKIAAGELALAAGVVGYGIYRLIDFLV